MYRPMAMANVHRVWGGVGLTRMACGLGGWLNRGLDWHGFCVYSIGVVKRNGLWVFEAKAEALNFLAYAEGLYLACLLLEQIERAMEAGWISRN